MLFEKCEGFPNFGHDNFTYLCSDLNETIGFIAEEDRIGHQNITMCIATKPTKLDVAEKI